MAKYEVSNKGTKKGYWKITRNGFNIISGITSKKGALSIIYQALSP